MERMIGALPPQHCDALCSLHQPQQVEIVLQNALHSQKAETTSTVRCSMFMRIPDFKGFLLCKETDTTFYCLWARSSQKQLSQCTNEWTLQTVESQLHATNMQPYQIPNTRLAHQYFSRIRLLRVPMSRWYRNYEQNRRLRLA